MNHSHVLYDADPHFKISTTSRTITNESGKTTLVQYDHNSERFTFEAPRFVEGHDLSECNVVRVHFINIERSKGTENKGFREITDLHVCPEDDELVACSWLIPNAATQLVGSLHFAIQFACFEGDELMYSWNTIKNTSILVSDGVNGNEFAEDNIDVLEAWRKEIEGSALVSLKQTHKSNTDGGTNIIQAIFGDGRVSEFEVKNGSRGEKSLIGSIETVDGKTMQFYHGTREKYNALTPEQKNNLFAVVTDEPKAQKYIVYFQLTRDFEDNGYIIAVSSFIAKGNVQITNLASLYQCMVDNVGKGVRIPATGYSVEIGGSTMNPVFGIYIGEERLSVSQVHLASYGYTSNSYPCNNDDTDIAVTVHTVQID